MKCKIFHASLLFLMGSHPISLSSHTPNQLVCSLNCLKVNEKVYVWPDGLAKCPGYFPASHLCSVFRNKIQSPATLGKKGHMRTNCSEIINMTFNHGNQSHQTTANCEHFQLDNVQQMCSNRLAYQVFILLQCLDILSIPAVLALSFCLIFSNAKKMHLSFVILSRSESVYNLFFTFREELCLYTIKFSEL